jgi:hypothetical protein
MQGVQPPYVWFPIELGGVVDNRVVFPMSEILAGEMDVDGVHLYLVAYLREIFDMPDSDYISVLERFRQDPDGTGRFAQSLFDKQNQILADFYRATHRMGSPKFPYNPAAEREGRGLYSSIQGGKP